MDQTLHRVATKDREEIKRTTKQIIKIVGTYGKRRRSRRWEDDITRKEGTTRSRKATDRRQWKTLMEGYILQWMDKA